MMNDVVNINKAIRAPKILLINKDGKNVGIVTISEALSNAYNNGLDLVEVGKKDNIPVCKILDYGKWKYEQEKSKKKVVKVKQQTKEIKFRPNTNNNDLVYRAKQVDSFLKDGHKVKLIVRFRGREQEHMLETGKKLLENFISKLTMEFNIQSNASIEGNLIVMVIYKN